jgi:hypothetical protein
MHQNFTATAASGTTRTVLGKRAEDFDALGKILVFSSKKKTLQVLALH